jgi:MoaD family protein
MGKIKVKYLNVYSKLTGKKEEFVSIEDRLTLSELLNIISGYQKVKESVLDHEGRLKPHVWVLVNRERVTDLTKEISDGDTVVFSLPIAGG